MVAVAAVFRSLHLIARFFVPPRAIGTVATGLDPILNVFAAQ
jgi:hypothetical protein